MTAIVKLFLKKPDGSQALVQRVLQTATKDCDSADVRDRAYIYWRLLSTDASAAKVRPKWRSSVSATDPTLTQSVVLSERPPISLAQTTVSPAILEELLGEISSLASVYHKPAATFVGKGRLGASEVSKRAQE